MSYTTVTQYIESFPDQVKPVLETLRRTILEEIPDAEEVIKYDMPTFLFHGSTLYFAGWKKHVSIYPVTSAMESSIPELKKYILSGKGTVQFPLSEPLPVDTIRKIAQERLKEALKK